jgi:hypothetical protein
MTNTVQTSWNHSDPTLNARASAGLDAMAAGGLGGDNNALNQWYALTALRGLLCGYLIGSVGTTTAADGSVTYQVAFDLSDTTYPIERRKTAAALLGTIRGYSSFIYDSDVATQAKDTGFIPVAIIAGVLVKVAIVAGATVAIGYAVNQASQVINAIYQRKADAAVIQAKDAAMLTAVAQHVANEQAAGKQLPMSDATKAVIQQAVEATHQVIAKHDPEISSGVGDKGSGSPAWLPWAGGAAAGALLLGLVFAAVRKAT